MTARKMLAWLCMLSHGVATARGEVAFPLQTKGRFIVDSAGYRVKWACTNWYGAHMKQMVPNGLDKKSPVSIAAAIRGMGFNCVRLPYSTHAAITNPAVRPEYISAMSAPIGQTFLSVFDSTVKALTDEGLMVIINNHNSDTTWCCDLSDNNGLWFNANYNQSVWIESLVMLAKRYRDNQLVVAYDIRNEPRPDLNQLALPFWGQSGPLEILGTAGFVHDWRLAAEEAGAAVLVANPGVLIVVEPVYYAGFMCAWQLAKYPLRGLDGHLVWSVHDFSWFTSNRAFGREFCSVEFTPMQFVLGLLGHQQSLPKMEASYTEYAAGIDAAWGHIAAETPLWIGEFGENSVSDWWRWFIGYVDFRDLDWAYWSVDGYAFPKSAENFGEQSDRHEYEETYGILNDDFETVRHDWKLKTLQEMMGARHGDLPATVLRRKLNSTGFVQPVTTTCSAMQEYYKEQQCCGNGGKLASRFGETCSEIRGYFQGQKCCGNPSKQVPEIVF